MCDYSLQHVASRAAKVQDRLVTATFPNSMTRGFTSIGEPGIAVCLMPGTEIAFDNDVECQPAFRLFRTRKIGQRLARFRQVDANQPSVHHDALEFPDGQIVLVTRLRPGQTATVLQLPATARPEAKAEPKSESRSEPTPTVVKRDQIADEPA
jgi:ribosomal 50S subunit-recycling heat shock protein